ncbi:glycosyltransferase [Pontibacter locisalis]|uniref:Glycosyltransferase n=1 Tax=Pontibacter locisalis TaxID=1719035 RepID=A0ABW5IG64_9BACT
MSEKRILIASLLKPINDTRMYEKLGLSLSKLKDTHVYVCGFKAPLPAASPGNLSFQPFFSFKRLSMGRVKAQLRFYRLLEEIKPDVLIACTHELLLPCYAYRRKHKVKLIYDVQENYALNLLKQNNYPPLLKQALALGVRSIEKWISPKIHHFLLAERSYADELLFLENRYTVLENKYKPSVSYTSPATPVMIKEKPLRLLYSGTIGEEYGIFEAIALAEKLFQVNNTTTFTIIGYCANKGTLHEIKQRIKEKGYIRLVGGDKLVPHEQIIEEINGSNVGLLPYQPNDSTFRCIPTKLYEYMAHALPILVQQNPLWHSIVKHHQAGISVDFNNIDEQDLTTTLRQTLFYTSSTPENIFWRTEEDKLLQVFHQMNQ